MLTTPHTPNSANARLGSLLAVLLLVAGCSPGESPEPTWQKGNLHAHSLWSDGDDFPEMIVSWYKEHGYDFIALTEHNVIADGEKWLEIDSTSQRMAAYGKYLEKFGAEWVDSEERGELVEVRLKALSELREHFEEPGEFLVVRSEEITDQFDGKPVHLNAINLQDLVPPLGGETRLAVLQNTVNAVVGQRSRTGQAMLVKVNHPNFGWALTPEDLANLEGAKFFEVYNGHPAVRNLGDELRVSTERMWDIVLAERLNNERGIIYGVAVDDAHSYHEFTSQHANPGRGWVMVRSDELSGEAIVTAMDRGDFYSSTGVRIRDIRFEGGRLSLEISADENVSYTTQFIGTLSDYDTTKLPIESEDLTSVRYRYSDEIGTVLAEETGLTPRYTLAGNELYVRAKVVSTKEKGNPNWVGEVEVAWTQPYLPDRNP